MCFNGLFHVGVMIYHFIQFGSLGPGALGSVPAVLCFFWLLRHQPSYTSNSSLISAWNYLTLLTCRRKENHMKPIHVCMTIFYLLSWHFLFLLLLLVYYYLLSGTKCTFSCVHTSTRETTDGHSYFHWLTWCWNQKYRLPFLHWKRISENPFFSFCFGWTNKHIKGNLLTDTFIHLMFRILKFISGHHVMGGKLGSCCYRMGRN